MRSFGTERERRDGRGLGTGLNGGGLRRRRGCVRVSGNTECPFRHEGVEKRVGVSSSPLPRNLGSLSTPLIPTLVLVWKTSSVSNY